MLNNNQNKTIYKRSFLPLSLFNFYDNYRFNSIEQIKINLVGEKCTFDTINDYLLNCFKEYQNQHLMIQVLLVSPYIFFIKEKSFGVEIFNNNYSIHDKSRLLSIINKRYNLNQIDKNLHFINCNSGQVDFTGFYSDLFIYSYKLFFIETIESIYTSKPKIKGHYRNEFNSIKDIIKEFEKSKREIEKTDFSDEQTYEKLNNNINKIKNSLAWSNIKSDVIIDQLSLFSSKQSAPYHFFNIIDNNVKINEDLPLKRKNDILIPLFKELICRLFYSNVFHHSFDNRRLKKKMSSFTNKYYKIKK